MEIIKMTRDLGKAIQSSEEYIHLTAAKTANDDDETLRDMIGEFNLKKIEIQTLASQEEKDEQKINEKNIELSNLYSSIMENENMAEFNLASQAMNKMMNHINTILMAAVNGDDPETCDLEPAACGGGDCGSCGGCH